MGSSVSEELSVGIFVRRSEDGGGLFLQKSRRRDRVCY